MGSSVQDSPNIVVARIVAAVDDRTAEVEVIRVLRGDHESGERIRMALGSPAEKIGETLVLSDPESFMGPTFKALPLDFEDEVRWLVERSAVTDPAEAIRRVEGYSNEGRAAGVTYLASAKSFPVGMILAALGRRLEEDEEGSYRAACLIDALTLQADPKAGAYLLGQVDDFLKGQGAVVDEANLSGAPSPRGARLVAVVGACGSTWSPMFFADGRERPAAYGEILAKIADRLIQAWPALDFRSQADAVQALAWTGAVSVDDLRRRLAPQGKSDGLALGLLGVGWRRSRVYAVDDARTIWTTALDLASRPKLVTALREELADLPEN